MGRDWPEGLSEAVPYSYLRLAGSLVVSGGSPTSTALPGGGATTLGAAFPRPPHPRVPTINTAAKRIAIVVRISRNLAGRKGPGAGVLGAR